MTSCTSKPLIMLFAGSWSEITKLLKQQRQNKPRQMSQQLQKLLPTSLDNNFWSKQCIPWKQANSAMKNNAVKMYKLEVSQSL